MQYQAYGGPEQIRAADLPCPVAGRGEILVKVAATSINPIDWKLHGGMLRWIRPLRFPSTPCFDFAGEVAAVGDGAVAFRPGKRVFGMLPLKQLGAAAEYLAVEEAYAAVMPQGLAFPEAAALPLAGMTALQALRDDGKLTAGQRVLISGAAGGVGHYGVQIAKAMGAQVAGLCQAAKRDVVSALGADIVLDYADAAPADPAQRYDVILDTTHHRSFGQWRPWLKPSGAYVALLPLPALLLHRLTLPLYSPRRVAITFLKPDRAKLNQLAEWVAQKRLRTVVDSAYPLAQLGAAIERSRSGRPTGKIVVAIGA